MTAPVKDQIALNAICPYFTMFPLDFPYSILKRRANKEDRVLDPFCGRGTTNFAARLAGLYSLGVDSSPVAAAITSSKLVTTTVEDIMDEARCILRRSEDVIVPQGEFWEWAYHASVLQSLSKFRKAFLTECSTPSRIALRGIILGALHGPKQITPSYFSNQCPRTYAPKPGYATRYWQTNNLKPDMIDVLDVIQRRANRYYAKLPEMSGAVKLADSRLAESFDLAEDDIKFRWVITSPPYYGMRTYIPDQWLRNWFIGGSDVVDYSNRNQIIHSSPDQFSMDLKHVWQNTANVCTDNSSLVIRFGGIPDRSATPLDLIKDSLNESGWKITTIRKAGTATQGKRQANSFLKNKTEPLVEYDVWAVKH